MKQKRSIICLFLLAVGLVTFFCSAFTRKHYGMGWDEPAYLESIYLYKRWFQGDLLQAGSRLSKANLIRHWGDRYIRDAHPPLFKLLACMFGNPKNPLPALYDTRLAACLLYAMGASLLSFAALTQWGWVAGCAAPLCWLGMPRVFGHSHFLAMDIAVSVFSFAITMSMIRRLDNPSLKGMLLPGILTGLGLLTKINAFFAPVPVLLVSALYKRWKHLLISAMVYPIGLVVMILGWPRLWPDPLHGLTDYFQFHLLHAHHDTFYLGSMYANVPVPWHYPWVMFAVSLPVVIWVCLLFGAMPARDSQRQTHHIILLAALFPMLLLTPPSTPAYDGIRLILPSMPWIALLAARGASFIFTRLAHRHPPARHMGGRQTAMALCAGFVLLLPTIMTHPYQVDFYNMLVGGPKGARRLGLESTYWGHAVGPDVYQYINAHAPQRANVWITPYSPKAAQHLIGQGFLRQDIQCTPRENPDLIVLHYRRGGFTALEEDLDCARQWEKEWTFAGVPMVRVYRIAPP